MSKVKVAVMFGGRSGEHEVSVVSAGSVLKALSRERYETFPVYITHDGRWFHIREVESVVEPVTPAKFRFQDSAGRMKKP